jgi:hypothetical protein
MDSSSASVASRHSYDGEVIHSGFYITFPCHVINIGDKVASSTTKVCSVPQTRSTSGKYAGVTDLKIFEAKSRENLVVNNERSKEDCLGKKIGESLTPPTRILIEVE